MRTRTITPSPQGSRRDWDAIDREVTRAEEEEKPEGEEALNKLFQQIYGNASEESRRRGERETHTFSP